MPRRQSRKRDTRKAVNASISARYAKLVVKAIEKGSSVKLFRPNRLDIQRLFLDLARNYDTISEAIKKNKMRLFMNIGGVNRPLHLNDIPRMNMEITETLLLDKKDLFSDPIVQMAYADKHNVGQMTTRSGSISMYRMTFERSKGNFFRFYNTTDIDLTDLQIYTREDYRNKLNDETHCLIFSIMKWFELHNIKTPDSIHIPSEFFNNGMVSTLDLTNLMKYMGIHLRLWKLTKGGKVSGKTFNKREKGSINPIVQIAYYENHYFVYYTSSFRPIGDYSDTLQAIKKLCEGDLFEKLDYDQLEKSGNRFDEYQLGSLYVKDEHSISYEKKIPRKNNSCMVYFDTEKSTEIIDDEEKEANTHKLYMLSFQCEGLEIITYRGEDSAKRFLDFLFKNCPRFPADPSTKITDKKRAIMNELGLNQYQYPLPITLVAHNISYDITDLLPHVTILNWLGSLTGTKGGTMLYKDLKLTLLDSYCHLNAPLRKLPILVSLSKEEQKTIKKEVMPYSLYSRENVLKENVTLKETISNLNPKDVSEFLETAKPYINGEIFRHMDYAQFYCEQDVRVLSKCFNKYAQDTEEALGIDPMCYPTTASLSSSYFSEKDCFNGCYKLSGETRAFVQKTIDGGRVLTHRQNKIIVDRNIVDLDARSLYPSAMYSMGGYPKGKAKQLRPEQFNFITLSEFDAYFIKVRVHRYRKNTNFPILFKKVNPHTNEDCHNGVKKYIFENPNGHVQYLNNISFEDLIYYHELEEEDYEILEGIYFNEGMNTNITEVIKFVYSERARLKREGSPLQSCYKLVMNSGYGGLCQKPIRTQCRLEKCGDKNNTTTKILEQHADRIEAFVEINNGVFYEYRKKNKTHETFVHLASLILAQSKRLMYRIYEVLPEGENVWYTDTDSVHISKEVLPKLMVDFKKKYGYDFDGEDLCQFHSDFEIGGSFNPRDVKKDENYCKVYFKESDRFYVKYEYESLEGEIVEKEEFNIKYVPDVMIRQYAKDKGLTIEEVIRTVKDFTGYKCEDPWVFNSINPEEYSIRLIALAAKTYYHSVRYLKKDGDKLVETITSHYRMKGIPQQTIERKAGTHEAIEDLYESLADGEEIEFDLLEGRVSFERLQGFKCVTRETFTRSVKYEGDLKQYSKSQ